VTNQSSFALFTHKDDSMLDVFLLQRNDGAYYQAEQGFIVVAPSELRARELAQMAARDEVDSNNRHYWLESAKCQSLTSFGLTAPHSVREHLILRLRE
jgi:hypothetical protein